MNKKTAQKEEVIIINGGNFLKGHVKISGAKNSALPNMATSILTDDYIYLKNIPDLADVKIMTKLLNHIGISSNYLDGTLLLKFDNKPNLDANYDFVSKMRASILVLGPMLSRFGYAKVAMPGGCLIGLRPIDLHIKALEKMGAKIEIKNGNIIAKAPEGLKGTTIEFEKITVTGTENIMMAATLAKGTTVLKNCAKEPEVVDLAKLLNKMGARIEGAGTDTITIEGVQNLKGATHEIIPDRIEAGTFAIISALTGNNIVIDNYPYEYLEYFHNIMQKIGIDIIKIDKNKVITKTLDYLNPVEIQTKEYPYFPTDLQAQMMVLLCFAKGKSQITENIFENRFMHVPQLNRMGANILVDTDNKVATIYGIDKLEGTTVQATDLRASAAMVIAGLVAEGQTIIRDTYHLYRGYENIKQKLQNLSADIYVDIISIN